VQDNRRGLGSPCGRPRRFSMTTGHGAAQEQDARQMADRTGFILFARPPILDSWPPSRPCSEAGNKPPRSIAPNVPPADTRRGEARNRVRSA
jgi:hypothetical protein